MHVGRSKAVAVILPMMILLADLLKACFLPDAVTSP